LRQFRENDKADVKDRHCLAPLVLKRTTLPVGQRDPKANGLPQERRKNRYRLMSALGQKQTFAPSSLAERSAEFIVQSTEKNAVGGNGCA